MRTNASQVVQEATSKAQPIFARQLDAIHGRGERLLQRMPEDEAEMLVAGDAALKQKASTAPAAVPAAPEEEDEAAELQRMREQYLGAARWVCCCLYAGVFWGFRVLACEGLDVDNCS